MAIKTKPDAQKYITRNEILKITGANRNKTWIMNNYKITGFPPPVARISGIIQYQRSAVMRWLKKNDLKTMPITQGEPRHEVTQQLDNAMAQAWLRTKPTFNRALKCQKK